MPRIATVFVIAAIALLGQPALAAAYPSGECTLSDDKSSVMVVASNPSDTSYSCVVSCRANVAGQRAFHNVQCSFNLGKNAEEKTVCEEEGGAPDFFTKLGPTKFACAPRN